GRGVVGRFTSEVNQPWCKWTLRTERKKRREETPGPRHTLRAWGTLRVALGHAHGQCGSLPNLFPACPALLPALPVACANSIPALASGSRASSALLSRTSREKSSFPAGFPVLFAPASRCASACLPYAQSGFSSVNRAPRAWLLQSAAVSASPQTCPRSPPARAALRGTSNQSPSRG